ncbi:hypothetical protein RB200_12520 [Streptomyces sp. PmtG]
MGIESDQLVFDYLSRVGDLAQQRQLPSAARMRLVAELRGEIDRRRAKAADSPAAVRRILDRLGTPDDLVTAAAGPAAAPPAAAPAPGPAPAGREPRRPRRVVPRPRRPVEAPAAPDPRPSPPHLASTEELGDAGPEPDWWRVERVPLEGAESLPGFVGGVEIPEMLKRPGAETGEDGPGTGVEKDREAAGAEDYEEDHEEAEEGGDGDEAVEDAAPAAPRRRFGVLPSLTKNAPPAPKGPSTQKGPLAKKAPSSAKAAPAKAAPVEDDDPGAEPAPAAGGATGVLAGLRSLSHPVLLLAAAALVVGAVIGNWFALGGGWIVVWFSRKLGSAEKKTAVIALPALAVAGGIGWLWGRSQGKWGEPIAEKQMNAAIEDTWPWVVRVAAVASALFVIWRSQRQRPE